MFEGILGFFELGGIVLAWMIFWNFVLKGWMAQHAEMPAVQGLAAIFHA